MTDEEIINQIALVRINNNARWMQLLSLAFKENPKEAKEIFKQITDNDLEINKLSKQLCKEKQ